MVDASNTEKRKVMKKDFIVRRSITMIDGKPHVETYSEQELIRCKDCKYVECEGVEGFLVCDLSGFSHSPEFFCADGERK